VLKATIPVSRAPRVAIVFVSVQAIVFSDGTMVDLPADHPIDHRSLATKQRAGGHTGSGNRAEAKPRSPGCGSLIQPPQEGCSAQDGPRINASTDRKQDAGGSGRSLLGLDVQAAMTIPPWNKR
jgi:hypothetical protein